MAHLDRDVKRIQNKYKYVWRVRQQVVTRRFGLSQEIRIEVNRSCFIYISTSEKKTILFLTFWDEQVKSSKRDPLAQCAPFKIRFWKK